MSAIRTNSFRCLLVTWVLAHTLVAHSTTVEELTSAGRLQLRSFVEPASNIVPGQQIKLTLEIATDRWFSGGTRIQIPEVPGLVILQTDNFASNSSERRNGQSWVVQRWSLDVYAQRPGDFNLPSLKAQIKVNSDPTTAVEGTVAGPPLSFSVDLPEPLRQASQWVAAPRYTVTQSFDRDLENLAIGDAIERTVSFKADNVMAMMLPEFKESKIPGLVAYPAPPELNNASNRGTTSAMRVQRITYIVEQAGDYVLPAQEFFWWDTRSGELELLSLPTTEVLAGNAEQASSGLDSDFVKKLLSIGAAALALLVVLFLIVRKLPANLLLNRLASVYRAIKQQWHKVRTPALPDELNPESNAGG